MWYRVFCLSDHEPRPDELLARLRSTGRNVVGHFRGDDLGWTGVELIVGQGTPIYADRYLTSEDDLRDDLNTWAAYLETLDYSPNHLSLMEQVIQTKQLITIRKPLDHPNETAIEEVCRTLCQAIATSAEGIYQVESVGWYAASGECLLEEY